MGASLSNLTENGPSNGGPGLGDIPESCVACVFLYLSPPEICNLARLNRAFRGAASSDAVWETKLPPNYLQLFDLRARPDVHQSLRKKDIFALLSRPLPFDDGNKAHILFIFSLGQLQVVWVDKFTGRVCMSVSAKAMAITGIEDRRYWNWVPTEESSIEQSLAVLDGDSCAHMHQLEHVKFNGFCSGSAIFSVVAYLQQIWWFEVDGTVKFPLPPDIYTLSFRIHLGRFSRRLGRRVSSFEHTHGWEIKPVRFEFSTSNGQQASSECFLDEPQQDDGDSSNNNNNNSNSYYTTSHKRGCWIDYKVGEFTVRQSDCETEVRFSMKQIDCTHSKGGLCVDSVSIIPVELKGHRGRGVLK
ncbi:F-box family protein [Striga asiatica]|uniref:F-box family protein n=1 Tax=Striga asiatica TaxID=4170 RepID=A0A5A7Q4G7_STRAF|nr:F-box family protein [Striga asiatica]